MNLFDQHLFDTFSNNRKLLYLEYFKFKLNINTIDYSWVTYEYYYKFCDLHTINYKHLSYIIHKLMIIGVHKTENIDAEYIDTVINAINQYPELIMPNIFEIICKQGTFDQVMNLHSIIISKISDYNIDSYVFWDAIKKYSESKLMIADFSASNTKLI